MPSLRKSAPGGIGYHWELHLKVKGLPLPSPSSNPLQVGTLFLWDNLEILDLTLESAWYGADSSLFICFSLVSDWLRARRAKCRLLPIPNKIFLDVDLVIPILWITKEIMSRGPQVADMECRETT
jgi:hypothetical protein